MPREFEDRGKSVFGHIAVLALVMIVDLDTTLLASLTSSAISWSRATSRLLAATGPFATTRRLSYRLSRHIIARLRPGSCATFAGHPQKRQSAPLAPPRCTALRHTAVLFELRLQFSKLIDVGGAQQTLVSNQHRTLKRVARLPPLEPSAAVFWPLPYFRDALHGRWASPQRFALE